MNLARGTQQSQGLTDMSFATIPHPLGMISKEEVQAKVDAAFDGIVKAATQWQPTKAAVNSDKTKPYPAARFKFKGTTADVNELFFKRKWSLSLPIIPPTVEKVQAMLKGTKRNPAEVVWTVPPRQGILTVELVATLGVMAGAKPEYMPLLLAAVEAFADPAANWAAVSTTTAATTPIVVISGPIVEKLGLNCGTGTAGAENPVTNTLGYFINLVGDVVGGSMPPNIDKSTHGSSGDLVAMVFTENAKENPWQQTYAEEIGFKHEDSVVTVYGSYPGNANVNHNDTSGKKVLNTFASGILGTASGIGSCFADPQKPYAVNNAVQFTGLMLGPEHAKTIYQEFPTKQAVKEYLIKAAAMPHKFYASRVCTPPAEFGAFDDETIMPRYTNPESIKIFVTGGAGKQSQIWSAFVQVTNTVSKKIVE